FQSQSMSHVVCQDEPRRLSLELEVVSLDLHRDDGAVPLAVAPQAPLVDGRFAGNIFTELGDVLRRADGGKSHRGKLIATVAVVANGSVIYREECERFRVVDPHEQRTAFEYQPVALLRRS